MIQIPICVLMAFMCFITGLYMASEGHHGVTNFIYISYILLLLAWHIYKFDEMKTEIKEDVNYHKKRFKYELDNIDERVKEMEERMNEPEVPKIYPEHPDEQAK